MKTIPTLQIDPQSPKSMQRTTELALSQIVQVVNTIGKVEIVNGPYINQDLLINKDTLVAHGLGRKYRKLATYNAPAGVRIWESDTPNTQPELFIIVRSSNSVNADLLIV